MEKAEEKEEKKEYERKWVEQERAAFQRNKSSNRWNVRNREKNEMRETKKRRGIKGKRR